LPVFRTFSPSPRQIFPVRPHFRVFAVENAQFLSFSAFYRIVFHIFTVVCSRFFTRLESMKKFFRRLEFFIFVFREFLLLFCKIRISTRVDFLAFLARPVVR